MKQAVGSVLLLFAFTTIFAQANYSGLTLYNGNTGGVIQTPLRLGNWATTTTPPASFDFNTSDNGTSSLEIHATRWGHNFLLSRDDPKGTINVFAVYGANNSNTGVSIFNSGNQVGISLNSQADSYFNGGGLAIGTTSAAGYKLAVNGTAVFTKAIVKPFPWSDYVFDKDYRLPTLDSVSRFIAAHHHLPDMPSADSVAAAGIDVGQNQSLLLKKIEELTLYIIQQQREIEELRKQVRGIH